MSLRTSRKSIKCGTTFKRLTNSLMRKHVPTKFTRSRPSHMWINTYLNKLTRRKNRLHKKAKKTQKRDWGRYQRLKSTSQREIRLARENSSWRWYARTPTDSGPTSNTKSKTRMGYHLSKVQTDCYTVILHPRQRSSTTSFTRYTLRRICPTSHPKLIVHTQQWIISM